MEVAAKTAKNPTKYYSVDKKGSRTKRRTGNSKKSAGKSTDKNKTSTVYSVCGSSHLELDLNGKDPHPKYDLTLGGQRRQKHGSWFGNVDCPWLQNDGDDGDGSDVDTKSGKKTKAVSLESDPILVGHLQSILSSNPEFGFLGGVLQQTDPTSPPPASKKPSKGRERKPREPKKKTEGSTQQSPSQTQSQREERKPRNREFIPKKEIPKQRDLSREAEIDAKVAKMRAANREREQRFEIQKQEAEEMQQITAAEKKKNQEREKEKKKAENQARRERGRDHQPNAEPTLKSPAQQTYEEKRRENIKAEEAIQQSISQQERAGFDNWKEELAARPTNQESRSSGGRGSGRDGGRGRGRGRGDRGDRGGRGGRDYQENWGKDKNDNWGKDKYSQSPNSARSTGNDNGSGSGSASTTPSTADAEKKNNNKKEPVTYEDRKKHLQWKEERARIDAERLNRKSRKNEAGKKEWTQEWDGEEHKTK